MIKKILVLLLFFFNITPIIKEGSLLLNIGQLAYAGTMGAESEGEEYHFNFNMDNVEDQNSTTVQNMLVVLIDPSIIEWRALMEDLEYNRDYAMDNDDDGILNRDDPDGDNDRDGIPNGNDPDWDKMKWTLEQLKALVQNAQDGMHDPQRCCASCCLNAFASNLKNLYGSQSPNFSVSGTMSDAVKPLTNLGLASPKYTMPPSYNGANLSSRSNNDPDFNYKNINNKISATLKAMAPDDAITIFAVGPGSDYHSTIIAVIKNAPSVYIAPNLETYFSTNDDPLYVFIEDNGGARFFKSSEMDNKMNEYLNGARSFYRGERKVGGVYFAHPGNDINLDASIFQLYNP